MTTPLAMLDVSTSSKESTAFKVLGAIGFSHLLNDMIQSLLPAIYPLLKSAFVLSFTQIGLITLTFQITASLLQPVVGLYTDHHPKPYSLSIGMGCTLIGLIILGVILLLGVRLVRPSAPSARGNDPEEAQLLQEIHRSLGRLEARVETLETLVLDSRAKGDGPCDT